MHRSSGKNTCFYAADAPTKATSSDSAVTEPTATSKAAVATGAAAVLEVYHHVGAVLHLWFWPCQLRGCISCHGTAAGMAKLRAYFLCAMMPGRSLQQLQTPFIISQRRSDDFFLTRALLPQPRPPTDPPPRPLLRLPPQWWPEQTTLGSNAVRVIRRMSHRPQCECESKILPGSSSSHSRSRIVFCSGGTQGATCNGANDPMCKDAPWAGFVCPTGEVATASTSLLRLQVVPPSAPTFCCRAFTAAFEGRYILHIFTAYRVTGSHAKSAASLSISLPLQGLPATARTSGTGNAPWAPL